MVAPTGIANTAASAAKTATSATGKTAEKDAVAKFDKAMQDPGAGAKTASPDAANQAQMQTQQAAAGTTNAQAGSVGNAPAVDQAPAVHSPGDRILKGIDSMRAAPRELLDKTGQAQAPTSGQPATAADHVANTGRVGDLLDMQASLIGFEVKTQVGGKAAQETNTGVQTLLKGQ